MTHLLLLSSLFFIVTDPFMIATTVTSGDVSDLSKAEIHFLRQRRTAPLLTPAQEASSVCGCVHHKSESLCMRLHLKGDGCCKLQVLQQSSFASDKSHDLVAHLKA